MSDSAPLTRGRQQTAEQQARDLLERMGVEDAQSYTAGDIVELANVIADQGWQQRYHDANAELRRTLSALEAAQHRIRLLVDECARLEGLLKDAHTDRDAAARLIAQWKNEAVALMSQWRETGATNGAIYASGLFECADDLAGVLGE